MNLIIEPVAKRLFDGYYRYCDQSGLEELQYITEEAFKLHERLRKRPGNKAGLHDIDEFLLLKALRNYSVHQGEFVGEAYGINRADAVRLKLDLAKVCLIKKETVKLAINYEPRRENAAKEQNKVQRLQGQLVDFGEYYNLEPVIYNFIVKVYELLTRLKISVPGNGFKKLDTAYQRESYFRYDHYVVLKPMNVESSTLLDCLVPMKEANFGKEKGLPDPKLQVWANIGVLELDYNELTLMTYTGDDYELMLKTTQDILRRDQDSRNIVEVCPNYIGIAIIAGNKNQGGLINGFNINLQKVLLEKHEINIHEDFYNLAMDEFLVFSIFDEMLFPVIISRQDILSVNVVNKSVAKDIKPDNRSAVFIKGKKNKKSKRKQASKARKVQVRAKK